MPAHAIQQVPTDKLVSPGNIRARLDEEEQVSLAQSIAQNGILVPHPPAARRIQGKAQPLLTRIV